MLCLKMMQDVRIFRKILLPLAVQVLLIILRVYTLCLMNRLYVAKPPILATRPGQSSDTNSLLHPRIIRNIEVVLELSLLRKERARCKMCGAFLEKDSNTSLKTHMEKSCPSLKGIPSEGQASMTSEGGIWNFDPNIVRDRMTRLVIQEGLPFNHFDNPRLTRMIQETLQPRYNQKLNLALDGALVGFA
ncbi:hypothetical protein L1987_51411 [Smallanthus sonchifolius]|uniref:Uncharacterized protein n=1 Tax=Smallanthus sonchifolius TaxID=185202 RepID=A0ACB9ERD2_9ASTR|nr:hypothetical protein L1987_51411 [Smallanthus sonchifolius]